jgi:hypothetical protein
MKPTLLIVALLLCSPSVAADRGGDGRGDQQFATHRNHDLNARLLADSSLYKRRSNWQQIVDQFWGPGLPRSGKQQVFDTFAEYIHDVFPGFWGLNINWDSLRAFYSQQITDSTSRGGFSGILSRFAHDMHDFHVMGWDTIMQSTPLNPGVPILALGLNQGDVRHFGAVLTPLPDSSLLVIRAVAGHPLNLQPGDIIVGYEGVPWKRLVFELLDSFLPRMGPMGSSESARIHQLLLAAGLNWHLFDTIDVIRYHSGALEHLPTSPLSSLSIPEYMPNNEQLPVPSVPQPDYDPFLSHANNVSHGMVEGTNIGYIYISGHGPGTRDAFGNAVAALMETEGLIIDMRLNNGGSVNEGPEAGLALLMNYSTQTLIGFERSSPADLYTLKPVAPTLLPFFVTADPNTLYDKPIAVLLGPYTISQGDFTAHKFRFLPGARFFGKSINGAVSGPSLERPGPVVPGFFFMVPFFVLADHREPNVVLLRKEFPVDEPVWLEKDDVALGDDTVVREALNWITSVAHSHGTAASSAYCRPSLDTIRLTARVENPKSHPISLTAHFMADSLSVDSTLFADDGQHGDGAANDGLWGTFWIAPAEERFYRVTTKVIDPSDPSTFSMPYAARFTTAGPISYEGCHITSPDTIPNAGDQVRLAVFLKNRGMTLPVPAVNAKVTPLDSGNLASVTPLVFGTVDPGITVDPTNLLQIRLSPSLPGPYVAWFSLDISSQGIVYWRDTMSIDVVTGIEAEERSLPRKFSLNQNYPNPFNPHTTIKYELSQSSMTCLSVYDVLGREVSVLVNEWKNAGSYELKFDASGLSSGVYLYRLQAGDVVQSRKLLLLR